MGLIAEKSGSVLQLFSLCRGFAHWTGRNFPRVQALCQRPHKDYRCHGLTLGEDALGLMRVVFGWQLGRRSA